MRADVSLVRSLLPLALLVLTACGSGLSAPEASAGKNLVSFEPSADPSAVAGVFRARIRSSSLDAGQASLFQGTLSSYYLGRIKSGDLPDTLTARQIPLVSWRENGELVIAPTRALPDDSYSLASASGLLSEFQVVNAAPLLDRLWPPASELGELSHVVYCGDGSAPLSLDTLRFEPGDLAFTPLPGADESALFADRCVHFEPDTALTDGQIVVPPPALAGFALDPAPFSAVSALPVSALGCPNQEIALGLGCATIADDRITVHTPDAALLWTIDSGHGSLLEVSQANPFVVRGLTPGANEHLAGRIDDESGAVQQFELTAAMQTARERPVLNEALANPLGPEPQSEWIEIVNDGEIALELSHFSLRDGGGTSAFPEATLAPGEYVLVARDDFTTSSLDVPLRPGTRVIRVPALGKSGLSNSGEMLALVDHDANVISALPSVATDPGKSLIRRHSWSPDDDPSAFSTGTPTPGAPND